MRILLLGCGNVGANVARQLVARHPELELVVGDLNLAAAEKLAGQLGGWVQAVRADVLDPACLDGLLDGADLVFNAVGPFYRSAVPVIEAALRARVDYLDINDDHDVAETLFLDPVWQQRAQEAGIRLIIGCGSTPGASRSTAVTSTARRSRCGCSWTREPARRPPAPGTTRSGAGARRARSALRAAGPTGSATSRC